MRKDPLPNFSLSTPTAKARASLRVSLLLFFAALPAMAQQPATHAPAPLPDVIIFTNGDQLSGHLVQVIAGNVTFHSDIIGDVTVPLAKVKTLKARKQFAIIEKDQRLTRQDARSRVTMGTVEVEDNTIEISPPQAPSKTFPASATGYLVDAPTLHRELEEQSDLRHGWTGNITVGASLVQATNTSQTYNGSVGFLRAIPAVTWLPPISRISLNLSATYGLLTQPEILVNGDLIQAASEVKTNILHGDIEYDRYLSPRAFWLADSTSDHNFGSGLQLQHTYGLGAGITLIKKPKKTFDLKTDVHYEQQQFYNGVVSGLGTPSLNLIGMDLSEILTYTLTHNIKLNENLTLTPTFNVTQASSAVVNAGILFPVYRNLNFTVTSTDNYLGDPPVGYRLQHLPAQHRPHLRHQIIRY